MSTPVATKQHRSLIPKKCLEVECVSVSFKKPNSNNIVVKLVTELYKSTLSVVCNFHFPRIFFFNPSRLACSDNIEISRKMSQIIHVKL